MNKNNMESDKEDGIFMCRICYRSHALDDLKLIPQSLVVETGDMLCHLPDIAEGFGIEVFMQGSKAPPNSSASSWCKNCFGVIIEAYNLLQKHKRAEDMRKSLDKKLSMSVSPEKNELAVKKTEKDAKVKKEASEEKENNMDLKDNNVDLKEMETNTLQSKLVTVSKPSYIPLERISPVTLPKRISKRNAKSMKEESEDEIAAKKLKIEPASLTSSKASASTKTKKGRKATNNIQKTFKKEDTETVGESGDGETKKGEDKKTEDGENIEPKKGGDSETELNEGGEDNKTDCSECNRKFKNNKTLNAHIKEVHEKEQVACTFCSKTMSKRSLSRHYSSCTGIKKMQSEKQNKSTE